MSELELLKLRSLIAMQEQITQHMRRDMACYGQWMCAYGSWASDIQAAIEAITGPLLPANPDGDEEIPF